MSHTMYVHAYPQLKLACRRQGTYNPIQNYSVSYVADNTQMYVQPYAKLLS